MRNLDRVDVKLLRLLEADARQSVADLARAVGMSAPSVAARLKRLRETGTVRRFTVEVNPEALGYALSAYVRVRPVAGKLAQVAALLAELPEVVACDRITGDDCYIARVCVRSVGDLERLIDRINPLAQTHTSVVQSSPIARRLPPLDHGEGNPANREP